MRRFRAALPAEKVAAFADEVRRVVSEEFLDEVWTEMPAAWTEPGGEVLPLERVKSILLEGGL